MNYDYSKRDYLLPEGCKDLIDALKHTQQVPLRPKRPVLAPLPPVIGELVIPEHATVLQFARLLRQSPFRIIADLMDMDLFANIDQELDFDTFASIARGHGYIAKKANHALQPGHRVQVAIERPRGPGR